MKKVPSKRVLVTLPSLVAHRFEAFRVKHRLGISDALKLLAIEGLDAHAAACGEETIARRLCGCDPDVTCAAAFNRPFEGACRLARPAGEVTA